ncbi:GMC family oxidoreductase N-terminal domain-containing protein [Alkalibacillus haloalkaliphilus]|uniref:GMC family oxidoreductase N-terminal domain-containing protein n=1 Tax=Alkalibacillus haloalkaliphilus TaxID=94136 RepID=UPI000316BB8A|nr:GMC family oxidoreductase N-terminal domain-containing protein [Alkalibacillus haloalkaliphilus]
MNPNTDPDVIIIGAGGGGAVVAKELGELGIKVTVLEAGPWYGNKKWINPNQERGETNSTDFGDLDINLFRQQHTKHEHTMNDIETGRFRWGPADRRRPQWYRNIPKNGLIWQSTGVGGTTQHYWANSPRAYSSAIDQVWPISYKELIPYYEKVEATLPVREAPTTSKEALFYYGAKKAGWPKIDTKDPTTPGYRPQPNAILAPNDSLMDSNYSLEELSKKEGCTLCGHCVNGCPHGPSVEQVAKRSTNVSYIPLALKTNNVDIRPNTYTTKVLTEEDTKEGLRAAGVQFRNTWTGETGELYAKVIVMAAGCIETPRLWLNSNLPDNSWVGRGMTHHYWDWITGIFDDKDVKNILGEEKINPFTGQTSGGRFDYPGLGCIQVSGMSPGLFASLAFGVSGSSYDYASKPNLTDPWEQRGRVVGQDLIEWMSNYQNTLSILILTDDQPHKQNGVSVDPHLQDEHGPIPIVRYTPSKADKEKRDKLAKISAKILRKAGAKKILRTDWPSHFFAHMESNMRMGYVVDQNCEAYQVKRLFIADNSSHYNGIGGPNPTLTTQALATRTAEKLAKKYFG